MIKGFRDFILRGNVLDLAVAVVIGVAFTAIVDSLVADILMPIIGLIGGQPDFSRIALGPVRIGAFLNALIAFLIKAAGLYFLVVLPLGRFLKAKPPAVVAPPPPPAEVQILGEIRDLLRVRERAPV